MKSPCSPHGLCGMCVCVCLCLCVLYWWFGSSLEAAGPYSLPVSPLQHGCMLSHTNTCVSIAPSLAFVFLSILSCCFIFLTSVDVLFFFYVHAFGFLSKLREFVKTLTLSIPFIPEIPRQIVMQNISAALIQTISKKPVNANMLNTLNCLTNR